MKIRKIAVIKKCMNVDQGAVAFYQPPRSGRSHCRCEFQIKFKVKIRIKINGNIRTRIKIKTAFRKMAVIKKCMNVGQGAGIFTFTNL
jgi:hypothetical protein